MGHTSVGITADRYSHLLPGQQRMVAEVMDQVLAGQPSKTAREAQK
jgi:hypothetical protein